MKSRSLPSAREVARAAARRARRRGRGAGRARIRNPGVRQAALGYAAVRAAHSAVGQRRLEGKPPRSDVAVQLKQVRDELVDAFARERAHEAVKIVRVARREHVAQESQPSRRAGREPFPTLRAASACRCRGVACPERAPELGFIVPTSWSMPRELSVKSRPRWQKPQPSRPNNALPASPSAVSVPSGFRNGLGWTSARLVTYAARSSSSGLSPASGSPSGSRRVPSSSTSLAMKPRPENSSRISFLEVLDLVEVCRSSARVRVPCPGARAATSCCEAPLRGP